MTPAQQTSETLTSDTIRRVETIYAGIRMLELESDEKPTLRRAVWRLFQEAVQTQRAIKRPGPAPVGSGMPEVYHTAGEIFATEVEMTKDQIAYAPRIQEVPTAAALDRYNEVMTWLRYMRGHNLPRARKTMIYLAGGVPPSRVADIQGYPNANAVEGVRYRGVLGIVERLRRDLPKDLEETA